VHFSILTGSYDGVARVWNTNGELLLDTVECSGHNGQSIKCVTWISDGAQSQFIVMCRISYQYIFVFVIFSVLKCLKTLSQLSVEMI